MSALPGRSLVRDKCPAVLWHISQTMPLRARLYRDSTLYVNYRPHQTRPQTWAICGRISKPDRLPVIRPARATVRVLKSDRSSWSAYGPNLPWESDRCCRGACSVPQRVERSTLLTLVPAFAFGGGCYLCGRCHQGAFPAMLYFERLRRIRPLARGPHTSA
jgi:hypothetical protein